MLPRINSFTNWGKLEEVWLGDVYPASWYDHLESEVRDCFYHITEITKQDLAVIEKKLQDFGVIVQRPRYDRMESFLHQQEDRRGTLRKPDICPRDHYVTIGNSLYADTPCRINPWQHVLDQYRNLDDCHVKEVLHSNIMHNLSGAMTVRAGRDIYFDLVWHDIEGQTPPSKQKLAANWQKSFTHEFQDRRIHLLFNGGHIDGCMALLKPGLILSNMYFDDYARTFPGWHLINCSQPEFFQDRRAQRAGPEHNGKWYLPEISDRSAFNQHVQKHALDWIGDYTETFFEVNCLVLDEKNVLVLGQHDLIFREMEKFGITAHSVPFRTRTFWDGGMHCLTLDIRRQDSDVDLFPDRAPTGIFVYE